MLKENYVLETFERVKNIISYLSCTLIFRSEKCKKKKMNAAVHFRATMRRPFFAFKNLVCGLLLWRCRPVPRPLCRQGNTESAQIYISMKSFGFETSVLISEWSKTVLALNCVAIVICIIETLEQIKLNVTNFVYSLYWV